MSSSPGYTCIMDVVEYSVGSITESIGSGALGRLGHFIT